jgi:hypothetical protein
MSTDDPKRTLHRKNGAAGRRQFALNAFGSPHEPHRSIDLL